MNKMHLVLQDMFVLLRKYVGSILSILKVSILIIAVGVYLHVTVTKTPLLQRFFYQAGGCEYL